MDAKSDLPVIIPIFFKRKKTTLEKAIDITLVRLNKCCEVKFI